MHVHHVQRFAVQTDWRLQPNFVVDRCDGQGPVTVTGLKWLIGNFIGPGLTDPLEEELAAIDTDLGPCT